MARAKDMPDCSIFVSQPMSGLGCGASSAPMDTSSDRHHQNLGSNGADENAEPDSDKITNGDSDGGDDDNGPRSEPKAKRHKTS